MYDLTLLSIFRDSVPYLARYVSQIEEVLPSFEHVHLIWLEGDSLDDTPLRLAELADGLDADVTRIEFSTGGSYWPSIDHPGRWVQLEACWNKALSYLEPTDLAVCVESDLIWHGTTLDALIHSLRQGRGEVLCPMLMRRTLDGGTYFYDTNAFRKAGQHFTNYAPYHPALVSGDQFIDLETAGGMLVTTGPQLSQARWTNKCVLHFAPEARVVLDTQTEIYHP